MKQHKISLTTAILMSLNIMIGSGILIGPGVMASVAGNASFLGIVRVLECHQGVTVGGNDGTVRVKVDVFKNWPTVISPAYHATGDC